MWLGEDRGERLQTAGRDRREIEAGAEALTGTLKHHGAHPRFRAQPLGDSDDRVNHRHVERVVLVGPRQRDDGYVLVDRNGDALAHPCSELIAHSNSNLSPTRTAPGRSTRP